MNGPDARTVDLETFCGMFRRHPILKTVRDIPIIFLSGSPRLLTGLVVSTT
jgi:hypothetical protein